MQQRALFVETWNDLVQLYHSEGRAAVERRHVESAGDAKEARRQIAALSHRISDLSKRDESTQAELQDLADARRAADARHAAALRLLERIHAQDGDVWELSLPERSASEAKRVELLNWNVPIQRPAIVGFDSHTNALRTWHECIESVNSSDSRAKGLKDIQVKLKVLENELAQRAKRTDQRIAAITPNLDTESLLQSDAERRRVFIEVEKSIEFNDPLRFRISIVRRFLTYAIETGRLHPPDWDFLIAISPHPREWCVDDPRRTEIDITDTNVKHALTSLDAVTRFSTHRTGKLRRTRLNRFLEEEYDILPVQGNAVTEGTRRLIEQLDGTYESFDVSFDSELRRLEDKITDLAQVRGLKPHSRKS